MINKNTDSKRPRGLRGRAAILSTVLSAVLSIRYDREGPRHRCTTMIHRWVFTFATTAFSSKLFSPYRKYNSCHHLFRSFIEVRFVTPTTPRRIPVRTRVAWRALYTVGKTDRWPPSPRRVNRFPTNLLFFALNEQRDYSL